MEANEAAKTVFICYRQLEELLRNLPSRPELGQSSRSIVAYDSIVSRVVRSSVPTYNSILVSLKECFALDNTFLTRVDELQPIDPNLDQRGALEAIRANGAVLRGTAHAFIELYLSPEEKKKAIGFQSP